MVGCIMHTSKPANGMTPITTGKHTQTRGVWARGLEGVIKQREWELRCHVEGRGGGGEMSIDNPPPWLQWSHGCLSLASARTSDSTGVRAVRRNGYEVVLCVHQGVDGGQRKRSQHGLRRVCHKGFVRG